MGDYGETSSDFREKDNDAECEGWNEVPEENTTDDEDEDACGNQDKISGNGEGHSTVNGLARQLYLEDRSGNFLVLHVWDDELVRVGDKNVINLLCVGISRHNSGTSLGE